MDYDDEHLLYTAVGPLVALFLGMALIPLRDFTTASNLTFVFIVLTIVVAEFGGRWAAVATALVSTLSLDFFLTQPYLRLVINDKHDIIAFAGLAICGLVAAALGSRRGERVADLRLARKRQDLLHAALVELEGGAAINHRAAKLLDACWAALPVAAIVLRDSHNTLVAAKPASRPQPERVLQRDTLLPPGVPDGDAGHHTIPLPEDGGRLALMFNGRQVGWLDVWGNTVPANGATRRAIADVSAVAAALLAQAE